MRYFALTTISSFAILSATALCAAHAAVNIGIPSFSSVRIEMAREAESRGRENQPNDRRGKGQDRRADAAPSEQTAA